MSPLLWGAAHSRYRGTTSLRMKQLPAVATRSLGRPCHPMHSAAGGA